MVRVRPARGIIGTGASRREEVSMSVMKWSGWGAEDVAFSADDKPALAPFIQEHLGLQTTGALALPVAFDALEIAEPATGDELVDALRDIVGAQGVSLEAHDRVTH